MYEFKAVSSDGNFTIGYDADGLAGVTAGNMVESFEKSSDFTAAVAGQVFGEFIAEYEPDSFGNEVLFWNEVQ